MVIYHRLNKFKLAPLLLLCRLLLLPSSSLPPSPPSFISDCRCHQFTCFFFISHRSGSRKRTSPVRKSQSNSKILVRISNQSWIPFETLRSVFFFSLLVSSVIVYDLHCAVLRYVEITISQHKVIIIIVFVSIATESISREICSNTCETRPRRTHRIHKTKILKNESSVVRSKMAYFVNRNFQRRPMLQMVNALIWCKWINCLLIYGHQDRRACIPLAHSAILIGVLL